MPARALLDEWERLALCARAGVDPFADDLDEVRAVVELCRSCPVSVNCRQAWERSRTPFGVWGGRLGSDLYRQEPPAVWQPPAIATPDAFEFVRSCAGCGRTFGTNSPRATCCSARCSARCQRAAASGDDSHAAMASPVETREVHSRHGVVD